MEDQSTINIVLQTPPESSLSYNIGEMQQVVENLLQVEGSTHMWQIVQNSGGFSGLGLVSSNERNFSPQTKLPEVYSRLSGIAGLDLLPVLPGSLPTAGQFEIELVVKSSDSYKKMKNYADQLVRAAFQSGKFLFADTDLKIDLPQIELVLNREKIADLGMDISTVSDQLSVLLSSNYVNRFNAEGKAYRVIPIIGDEVRSKPESILNLSLKLPDGELLPLSAVAELNWQTGPRKLGTFEQQKSFRIYGGALPGTTKEEALSVLEAAAVEILPPSYSLDYAGESRQLRQEGNTLRANGSKSYSFKSNG
ncbi:efflux RND transporter permease subunit [Thalassomonas viridans]|uniref:Efflux RND transporter permease subunit n=1 Tax=Thalassomonas viridans TaxID=137584 RepID=A0AAF0CEB7_9GAMM|nr:efflux RND transporter permease subunit [Thalassomonas viridans]WDE09331.1 efflux RND transporter permease subunit [Thalassomonas viridans]